MTFWPQLFAIADRLDGLGYYELLGVDPGATVDRVVARYDEVAGRLHPDRHARGASADQLAVLNRVLARLGEARRVLTTPALRNDYDQRHRRGDGARRVEADVGTKRPGAVQDPRHPMARQLFEQAQAMIRRGETGKARTTLGLARQYEPGSVAIAAAQAGLPDTRPRQPPLRSPEPATVPAPSAAVSTPAPMPVAAVPALAADATVTAPTTVPTPTRRSDEQRGHPRTAVAIPVRIRLDTWDKVERLICRDLSRGGMFVASSRPFEVGARVELTIETPVGEGVTLPAEVAHVIATGGAATAGMGIRFLGEPAAALVILDQLITRHRAP